MAAFYKATRFFKHHIGNLYVTLCRLIEGRCNHLCLNAALHIRYLFRTLVNKEHNLINLRVIVCNGISYALEQHCFTGLRLSDDKSALSLADRSKHVYNSAGIVLLVAMAKQIKLLVREKGSQEVEGYTVAYEFRPAAVDIFDANQREVFVTLLRRTDFSGDSITRFEGILLDLLL